MPIADASHSANDHLVASILDRVVDQVTSDLKAGIARTIEQELSQNLSRMLVQGEFFKRLSDDLQKGLKDIYDEIATAKHETKPPSSAASMCEAPAENPDQWISEASDQLDAILKTTEQATVDIMEIVEPHLDMQAESATHLADLAARLPDDPAVMALMAREDKLGEDLMRIMTALSFQDLTGQRIKRIIAALKKIETIVFETYVAANLQIQARAAAPDRDLKEVAEEAKKKASELKGPQIAASQGSVDDLLAQLGL